MQEEGTPPMLPCNNSLRHLPQMIRREPRSDPLQELWQNRQWNPESRAECQRQIDEIYDCRRRTWPGKVANGEPKSAEWNRARYQNRCQLQPVRYGKPHSPEEHSQNK